MAGKVNLLNHGEAFNAAFREEMRRDKRVVMWGEDMVSLGSFISGSDGSTQGIFEEFGGDRIMDAPMVESAIVEMAVGAAMTGLRPIASILMAGLVPCCFAPIFSQLGTLYQEWLYQGPLPVVIIASTQGWAGKGPDHALSPESLLMHSPGLKEVMPSTAYDAKGVMKTAIRDDSPVVFITHQQLVSSEERESIPSEEYLIPLGKADVKREGKDITIVAYSAMILKVLAAAEELSKEGISVEVVDLRCLVPMDVEAIVKSVKKTGCLLIVHEAMKRAGAAGEIAFRVTEAAPDVVKAMKTPIRRLAAQNMALPHSVEVENRLIPQTDDIVKAVKGLV